VTAVTFSSLATSMIKLKFYVQNGLNSQMISFLVVAWRSDSALVPINEVNLHRSRLVLGWVTVSRSSSRYGTFNSVF